MIDLDDIPEDLENGYISSIHKKGSKTQGKNYRDICVNILIGRLYGRIIKSRLEQIEEQNCFRSEISCLDNTKAAHRKKSG